MASLSSLAKTILLNHISRFHSSSSPIGRPRSLSFSYILDRILFLLSSGCQWSRLPVSNGSWKSIYHYFSLWSKHHLFQHAYDDLLRVYFKIRPRSSTRIVDTSFVKNVFGQECVGPSPFDRGRNATKCPLLQTTLVSLLPSPFIRATVMIVGHSSIVSPSAVFFFLATSYMLIRSMILLIVKKSFLVFNSRTIYLRRDNPLPKKIIVLGS